MVKAYLNYEEDPGFGDVTTGLLQVDPAAHRVYSACNQKVLIWDLRTEACVGKLGVPHHQEVVTSLRLLPSTKKKAKYLVAGYRDGAARLWNLQTLEVEFNFQGHKTAVSALACDGGHGLLVTGGQDTDLVLWDYLGRLGVARFQGHRDVVTGLAFWEGTELLIVSASKDFTVKLWSQKMGVCLQTLSFPAEILGIFVDHSQLLVCPNGERVLRVFGPSSNPEEVLALKHSIDRPHKFGVAGYTLLDGQKLLLMGKSRQCEVYDLKASTFVVELTLPGRVFSVQIYKNSLVFGLNSNEIAVGTLKFPEDGEPTLKLKEGIQRHAHRAAIRGMVVSHEDVYLASWSAEGVKVWNLQSHQVVKFFPVEYPSAAWFLPENEYLVVGTRTGALMVYSLRESRVIQTLEEAHQAAIHGLDRYPGFSGFLSCSSDKSLRLWKLVPEGSSISIQAANMIQVGDECLQAKFSLDGKFIACALVNHNIEVFFADTLKFSFTLYAHSLPVLCLAFPTSNSIVATGSADKTIRVWSVKFGNCLGTLNFHSEAVVALAFVPESHYLISASKDKTILFLDADTYEKVKIFHGHTQEIWCLALSFDGATIYSGGNDRVIRCWHRTNDQIFVADEAEQEQDHVIESEALREDLTRQKVMAENTAVSSRPTRRTIQHLRTTEELLKLLGEPNKEDLMGALQTLNAADLYEIFLPLSFQDALQILSLVSQHLTVCESALSQATELERPIRVALCLVHIFFRQLSSESQGIRLMNQLRRPIRRLLHRQSQMAQLNMMALDVLSQPPPTSAQLLE